MAHMIGTRIEKAIQKNCGKKRIIREKAPMDTNKSSVCAHTKVDLGAFMLGG